MPRRAPLLPPSMTTFRSKKTRSSVHLGRVRQLPCLVCGSPGPNHAHHIQFAEHRGLSQKVGDQWTVPLCGMCHHELHNTGEGEKLFWAFNGVDAVEVAKDLWSKSNAEAEASNEHQNI